MTQRILSFGTYPIKNPVHGGQRRCVALGQAHRSKGYHFLYCSAYLPGHYAPDDLSNFDYCVQEHDPYAGGWAGDVHVGRHCADRDEAFAHFQHICDVFDPSIFVLEHPFMWPVVKRLRAQTRYCKTPVIYSSHNVESLLKKSVLTSAGVPADTVGLVVQMVDAMERELVDAASHILAVSADDASVYRSWRPSLTVEVVPNGINAPPIGERSRPAELPLPYVLFVGSAHLPNRDGFLDLVLGDGCQFLPPEKHLVVAGGVSELIYQSPVYQSRLVSNGDRVQFFSRPSDDELAGLLAHASAILLPIKDGGGTNLKTAEAIVSGHRIIATPTAFRGFDKFRAARGVTLATTRQGFIGGIRDALASEPLKLSRAELSARLEVTWSQVLRGVDIGQGIA